MTAPMAWVRPLCWSLITQLHAGQPACAQGAQEFGPEHLGLAVTDVTAQHLAAAVSGHAGGDDDRA